MSRLATYFLILLFLNTGAGNELFSLPTKRQLVTPPAQASAGDDSRRAWRLARPPGRRSRHRTRHAHVDAHAAVRSPAARPRARAHADRARAADRAVPCPATRRSSASPIPTTSRTPRFSSGNSRRPMPSGFSICPSLGRVRRIAGSESQESFVGSDFTFEDIGGRELDDYAYRLIDAPGAAWTAPDGSKHPVYTLESRNRDASARFPRVVSLVRQDNFVVVHAEIHNKRDEVQKTFDVAPARAGRRLLDHARAADDRRAAADAHRARHREGRVQRRPEARRLQPARTRAERRPVSRALAEVLYRWRRVLCGAIVLGAVLLAPRANITENRQRSDRVVLAGGSGLSRVRALPRRVRRHADADCRASTAPVARSPVQPRGACSFSTTSAADIERVETVERVASLTTATLVDARPAADVSRTPMPSSTSVALDRRPRTRNRPAEVGQRALDDELLERRSRFRGRHGRRRSSSSSTNGGSTPFARACSRRIRGIVATRLPADFQAHFNGSLEISETYNRITLANQTKYTPPILVADADRDLRDVPIVAADAAHGRRRARERRSGRSASTICSASTTTS